MMEGLAIGPSMENTVVLLQFIEEVPDRQHPLLQIPILQIDLQFVLPRHLDVPFALDQRDDLHRVDRGFGDELDDDGFT